MKMKIQSNMQAFVAAGVFCTLILSLMGYAILTRHVNDQAVEAVRQAIVKLEPRQVRQAQVRITDFEYRPGFKGKYVRVNYHYEPPAGNADGSPSADKSRYFLIRKPVFDDWEVTYEIDEKEYASTFPGSGQPTTYNLQP